MIFIRNGLYCKFDWIHKVHCAKFPTSYVLDEVLKRFCLQDVEKAISDAEPVVEDALAAAQELMTHCSPDDVEILQRKVDLLSQGNERVKNKKEEKLCVLNETADLVKTFYDKDKDLKAFFTDASVKFENRIDGDVDATLVRII